MLRNEATGAPYSSKRHDQLAGEGGDEENLESHRAARPLIPNNASHITNVHIRSYWVIVRGIRYAVVTAVRTGSTCSISGQFLRPRTPRSLMGPARTEG